MGRYAVTCGCGQSVAVEIYQCGLDVTCPACRGIVRVPSSVKLQSAAGEKYPRLSLTDKIVQSRVDAIPPFDGACAKCGQLGTHVIGIRFGQLVERFIDEDRNGIQLSPLGVGLRVAEAHDQRREIDIPLVLCDECVKTFNRFRPRVNQKVMFWMVLACLFAGVFQLLFQSLAIAIAVTILALLKFVALRPPRNHHAEIPQWSRPWIELIPCLPEAVAEAMEPEIALSKPHSAKAGQKNPARR